MTGPFSVLAQTTLDARAAEVAVSPDGSRVAVSLFDQHRAGAPVRVLDAADLSLVAEVGSPGVMASGVAFVRDGAELRYLVERGDGRAIELHRVDLASGEDTVITHYNSSTEDPQRLLTSPDGRYMALFGLTAEVWDVEAGGVVWRARFAEGTNPTHRFFGAFAPSGPTLYAHGVVPGAVARVELLGNHVGDSWASPTAAPGPVVVSPDGARMGVCGIYGSGTFLYDLKSGARLGDDEWDGDTDCWELAFTTDSAGFVYALWAPTRVALEDFDEDEGDEIFERSQVRILRRATRADVYAFATKDARLVTVQLD